MNSLQRNIFYIFTLSLMSYAVISCGESPSAESERITAPEKKTEPVEASSNQMAGKKIMETKCYICHSPSADEESRIAPPMVAIKSHYLDGSPSKEDFKKALQEFVKKPSESNAIMKGAIKRFGVMPYQSYAEEDINAIAEYMYDYKIEEPAWFKKHMEEESHGGYKYNNNGIEAVANNIEKTDKEKGLEYAITTKKELGKNLMGTIQKKGTLEAVKFCNKMAYPITDSMAVMQNVEIKRVSDKPRNPESQANEHELSIIATFKKAIALKEKYEPYVEYEDDKVKFYSPIVTNSMCLQCHGDTKTDIKPDVLSAITSLYPNDAATGYDTDQVRGIWRVTFDK